MLRRDFVRAVLAVGAAPKLLLGQQAANPAPPPPRPYRGSWGSIRRRPFLM